MALKKIMGALPFWPPTFLWHAVDIVTFTIGTQYISRHETGDSQQSNLFIHLQIQYGQFPDAS